MDFLKKAGNFLGNAAYQAAKFVPGVGNVIRSYEQVSKNTNLARQQQVNRLQQQRKPVPQQLQQAPAPRLDYRAAMNALNALKGAPGQVANFVAPNTTKFAGQAVNTAQATQMRLNNIARQLTGQKIAPGDFGRIKQLEAGGFVPENVRQGKATPIQFAGAALKTGAPIGLEVSSFGKGISTANLGLRAATPALIKQGVVFGGAQTANNLAFGEGDFKQRLKNLPGDALNNVAGNVGGQFLGYGAGRLGKGIIGKLQAPTGTAAAGLIQQSGSKVRIDPKTGKKVFAPQYNPGGKATNSGLQADTYKRDIGGKFSKKQASSEGTTRVISERELNYFNKNGELPANPEGYTNIIKPGEINNIKGITDSKKYLVKLKDGVKIDSESGPQFAVKGGIDGKYVAEIAPYVKSADRVPVLSKKFNSSMYADNAIGNDVPSSVAKQLEKKVPGLKDRGFVKSVQGDFGVPSELSDALPKAYKPIKNAETFNTAKQIVDSDPSALNKLLSKPKNEITSVDQAQAQILLRRAIDDDNIKLAQRIATKVDVNAREAGRTVQILAAWKKTTPEGAFSQANKIIDEANSKLPANKQLVLTKDMTAKLKGLAEKVQSETIGTREHDVASALLEKELRELVPPSLGRKLSTIQSMAQLLNPKTAIRNLGGNSLFAGLENVSTTVGTGVDKVIGLGTKQRSVALPSYMTQIKGFIKGGKHGIEDTKLGIKTSGMAGQFEVQPSIFKSAIMKKLERVMGYELSVPDKAFYQAAFDDSLRNQMKAMKIAKPNAMLVDAANKEALYKTFQNNSKIAEVLSSGKKALNTIGINNKEFGLGDVVMKYPKTPGNILSSGIDYAGGGIVKGVAGLVRGARSGGITQGAQREAALNIGRGVTGLGLVGSGYGLAKAGVVTSDPNKDKDVMALERAAGQGPYNLNLSGLQRLLGGGDTRVKQGDLNANYDWLQPASLPFTIGANIGTKQKAGDATANVIDSVNASINTVTEQPVLAGLNRFFSGVAGKQANPTQALQNAVQGAPASFIPSIVNQIGQKDPYSRNTYDPNYLQGMLNQAKAKVPGLREGLQPRLDTFGNPTKQYEDNNFFNVFLNPAFTKHYNLTPEAKLVLDVNKGSGETSQFPRVAPYSTQVNGQKVELSGEQLRKFQEYTGLKTKTAYQQMVNDPKFQSLSDTDKAKRMSDVLTNVAAAAKIDVLGDKVDKNTSKDVKNIVSKGQVKYNNSSVSSGASTPSNPQERYQAALEKYDQDQADGKISGIKNMSRTSALDRLKVQSNFEQDTVDLYSQSKGNIDKYLKSQRNGGDLLKQLVALDDALVASGHASKLRNSKGELSITPKVKLSKAGGGKRAKTRAPKFTSTRSRGISRVKAKGLPKIKFAKLPSGGKSTKIKV